jgi:putative copper resistance protein D
MDDLLTAVRALHFAATLLLVGIVAFDAVVLAPVLGSMPAPADAPQLARSLRRIATTSMIVAVLSGAAWLTLFAHAVAADGAAPIELARSVLTQTQFGRVSLIRFIVAILLGALLLMPGAHNRAQRSAAAALALLFAGVLGASSHAAAIPGAAGALDLAGDGFHIIAAGVWLGGLLPLMLVLARAQQAPQRWGAIAAQSTRRFSVLAITSVAAIVVTGTLNAALLVGSIDLLFATLYGRILLFKIALLLVMLSFAATNKFRLTPRLPERSALAGLWRNSLAEAGLGLAIIGLVGALGTLPPAAHHHLQTTASAMDTAFVHLHGTAGMAEVTVAPGRAGPVAVKITLMTEDFAPLAARSVTFTFSNKTAGIAPRTLQATSAGDGNWDIAGLTVPAPGRWDVLVEAEIDATRRLSLDGPMQIEP